MLGMDDIIGSHRDLLIVPAGFNGPHGLGIKSKIEAYYESEIITDG